MIRWITCSGLLALLISAPILFAQELQATAQLYPAKEGVKTPSLQATSDDAKLIPKPNSLWVVELHDQKRALGIATITFNTQPPEEYKTQTIQVRIPYLSDGPVKVTLFAVDVDHSPKRVREIFGTNVSGSHISTSELYRLYQEAAYLSHYRLSEIEQKPRPFMIFDAQIFFKYLEIARELGRRVNLVMSTDVLSVQTYMRAQAGVDQGRGVLNAAIPRGTQDVKNLIDDIDFVDAEHLRKLWHIMEKQPDAYSPKACDGYRAFLTTVIYDFDDTQVKRWGDHKVYKMVKLVTDRLQTCVSQESAPEMKATAEVVEAIQSKAFVKGEMEKSLNSVIQSLDIRF